MPKTRALLIISIVLPGCFGSTVALEPRAKGVALVHESDRPLHCKVLGKISGTSTSSDAKLARSGAENDLRNQAAEQQGNFALVEAERDAAVGTTSDRNYFISGKALACETEAMEEAKEKAEAKAQHDKEDEQAQAEQKEADEKNAQKPSKQAKKSEKSK